MLFLERLVLVFVNILTRAFVAGMGTYAGQSTARWIGRQARQNYGEEMEPLPVRIIDEQEVRYFPVLKS